MTAFQILTGLVVTVHRKDYLFRKDCDIQAFHAIKSGRKTDSSKNSEFTETCYGNIRFPDSGTPKQKIICWVIFGSDYVKPALLQLIRYALKDNLTALISSGPVALKYTRELFVTCCTC